MSEGTQDLIQTLLLVATLWAAGIGLGMSVGLRQVVQSLRRPALVARTMTLDVILIPLAMWVAVRVMLPDDELGTGLLLVAFASAGPFGIKLADIARGDIGYAIGIVVVLEVVNVAAIPLWSSLLGVASQIEVVVDMARTLVILVILPIGLGMLVGRSGPARTKRSAAILGRASNIGLILIVTFLVIRNADALGQAQGSGALVAASLVIGFALAAGWLAGGPTRPTRVTTTSSRASSERLPCRNRTQNFEKSSGRSIASTRD